MIGTLKIGIMGGTFNPIHIGHLMIGNNAIKVLNLDKLLVVPSNISYMKDINVIIDFRHREAMIKLAINKCDNMEISYVDVNRGGNSYSYDTIMDIKNIYGDCEYYYILGEDNLMTIETWKSYRDILKEVIVAVAPRETEDISVGLQDVIYKYETEYYAKIRLLTTPYIDISSTEIRNMINEERDSIGDLLPCEVKKYIIDNNLYVD